tara:strand:- start:570 stop:1238 length:669 start_codon:yes stop_codon:yes gene_type:complete
MFWVGGILSFIVDNEVFTNNNWASGVFLYIASLIIFIHHKNKNRKILLFIGFFGFIAEILGSKYHIPFGEYYYTAELGKAIMDVPFSLFSAWIIISTFVIQILTYSSVSTRLWWILGPILMIMIDLIIEPISTGPMNAWVWIDQGFYYGVPISNFFGWFVVSLPIFIIIQKYYSTEDRQSFVPLGVILFFIVISIIKLILAPIIIFITICIFLGIRKKINVL